MTRLTCGRRNHRQKEHKPHEKTLHRDCSVGRDSSISRPVDSPPGKRCFDDSGRLSYSAVRPRLRPARTGANSKLTFAANFAVTPCCYTKRHGVEWFFPIERVLWIASMLAEALVVVRFVHLGLVRRYPLFIAYLTLEFLGGMVLLQHGLKSQEYVELYRVCNTILTIFRLGVAAELYERICDHFPGMGLFRAGMAAVLIALAGLIAVSTFRPNLPAPWVFPFSVRILLVVLRFQYQILASALVLTWIFLRYFLSIRQPFRPNVLTHWSIATVYFAQLTCARLAVYPINSAMLAIQLGCFVAWFRMMRRSGEELPRFQRLSPDQIQAVEKYNRELLEAVRALPDEISARQAENRDTHLHRAPQL
jgi:hypothetical protein